MGSRSTASYSEALDARTWRCGLKFGEQLPRSCIGNIAEQAQLDGARRGALRSGFALSEGRGDLGEMGGGVVRGRFAGEAARARELRAVVIPRTGETISMANYLRGVLIFTLLLATAASARAQSSGAAPASQPARDFLELAVAGDSLWIVGNRRLCGRRAWDGHDADTDFISAESGPGAC